MSQTDSYEGDTTMNSTLDMESECSTIESLTSESWLTEKLTTLEVKSFQIGHFVWFDKFIEKLHHFGGKNSDSSPK